MFVIADLKLWEEKDQVLTLVIIASVGSSVKRREKKNDFYEIF